MASYPGRRHGGMRRGLSCGPQIIGNHPARFTNHDSLFDGNLLPIVDHHHDSPPEPHHEDRVVAGGGRELHRTCS